MRYTEEGVPVTSFSVATSETWTKGGEKHQKTVWWKVQAWDKLAELANTYLAKGNAVLVQGRMTAGEDGSPKIWKDKDGNPHASYELKADVIRLQGKKEEE
jgi:single-strand DNA-binding protein